MAKSNTAYCAFGVKYQMRILGASQAILNQCMVPTASSFSGKLYSSLMQWLKIDRRHADEMLVREMLMCVSCGLTILKQHTRDWEYVLWASIAPRIEAVAFQLLALPSHAGHTFFCHIRIFLHWMLVYAGFLLL